MTRMPAWLKRTVMASGLVLLLPGLPAILGHLCMTLVQVAQGRPGAEDVNTAVATLGLSVLTAGAGTVLLVHSSSAMRGRASRPMRLPPLWVTIGIFGLLIAAGLLISLHRIGTVLFLPPLLLAAAALPPLWSVSWFARREAAGLTWRRGMVAAVGGATAGVLVALALEVLFPAVVLSLVLDLAGAARESIDAAFGALAGRDVAAAMTSPGFLYLLIQVAVVAPLAEELAKPLITLPILGRLDRRDAFWVGAMAGAGFAAVENVLYAGLGFPVWAGILTLRALGGAIHPLGAGLVALGWRDILRGEKGAWQNGAVRMAVAAGAHALWNGGSLLVLALGGAQFFGELPPQIDVLGLSAGGTTLALLAVLGVAALWLGRATGRSLDAQEEHEAGAPEPPFVLSDRAAAIWALACLAAIVPAGIAGLQIVLR
jgi:RsiW-degrading membrane proteinase PrsW (M82 family)